MAEKVKGGTVIGLVAETPATADQKTDTTAKKRTTKKGAETK